jgi:hypothetical protein
MVPLVWEKPPEDRKSVEFVDYEEILRTHNPADIALVRSILDAEDITYFVKGEQLLLMRRLADPAVILVSKGEIEAAKDALKEVDLNFEGISGADRRSEGDDDPWG